MRFWKNNGNWCLYGTGNLVNVAPVQNGGTTIPLEIAVEAYKEYSQQFGASQSLKRLNDRGGFCSDELCQLLFDRIERLEADLKTANAKYLPTHEINHFMPK